MLICTVVEDLCIGGNAIAKCDTLLDAIIAIPIEDLT